MRTNWFRSGAVVLALLCSQACAAPRPTYPHGPSVTTTPLDDVTTRLEITLDNGQHWSLRVPLDGTVAPRNGPGEIANIGTIDDRALVIVDTYPSKAGGMSYCQAGEESFLRVIRLRKHVASLAVSTKLESCQQNIELADGGLSWDALTGTLHVKWLRGPNSGGESQETTLRVE